MSTSPFLLNKSISNPTAKSFSHLTNSPLNTHIQSNIPNFNNNCGSNKHSKQGILDQQFQPSSFQQLTSINLKNKSNNTNKFFNKSGEQNNKVMNAQGLSFALIAPHLKVNKQRCTDQINVSNHCAKQVSNNLQNSKNASLLSELLMKKQTNQTHYNQNFNDINYTDTVFTEKKRPINYVQTSKSKMKPSHQKNNSCLDFNIFKNSSKNPVVSNKKKYQNSQKKQPNIKKQQAIQAHRNRQNIKLMSPATPGPQNSKQFFKDSYCKQQKAMKNIFQCSQVGSSHYSQITEGLQSSFRADSVNNSINNSIRRSIDYDQQIERRQSKQDFNFKAGQALLKLKDLNALITNKVKLPGQRSQILNLLNYKNECLSSFNKEDEQRSVNLLNFSAFVQKKSQNNFLNCSLNSRNGNDYKLSSKNQPRQSLSQFYQNILQNSSHSISNNDAVNTSFASITSYDNRSQISQSSSINFSKKFQKYKSKKQTRKIYTIEDFDQIREIGNGKYGKVTLVRNKKTKFICALKAVSKKIIKQENLEIPFMRQIKIQLYLNHPNIVKLYGFFDDKDYIYLIMQYCSDGHLLKTIQQKENNCFQQKQALFIISDVFQAVSFLHSRGIIHRDLKPQNIVIEHNVHKICDFGWAAYSENHMRTTFCGTPLYVSPQVLKGEQYDTKTDVWGLGVLTYQLIFGRVPFSLVTEHDLAKIINDPVYFPTWIVIQRQMKELIESMLEKNPRKRFTLNQILSKPVFCKFSQQCKRVSGFYSKQINLNLIN